MKKIYFVRHGESVMNAQNIVSGHTDTPLNPRGIEQARQAGKLARDKGLVFDVILSSPLQRAHDTAKEIATHVGYPHQDIELHENIKERNFGALEGKNLTEFTGLSFDDYASDPYAIDHLDDIERVSDLHNRAIEFWNYVSARPEDRILVVSHGSFGRYLQRAVKGLPLEAHIDFIGNAEIIELI